MNYRSVADMNTTIVRGLHKLPRDLDLVVGVPRSGLLAANLVSLTANIPMTDLDSFVAGRVFSSGFTKRMPTVARSVSEMRKVLIIDDSINNGAAMRDARARIETTGTNAEFTFAAVYGLGGNHKEVDHVFEVVPRPRMFQWNFMHHGYLGQSCVDIDGVLCADPTNEENDDGPAYEQFLRTARPLFRPSRRIAYLVTSRLEKYRGLTVTWLVKHGIQYNKLIMLDLPSKKERQRRSVHGSFKADFYRTSDAILFIESEYSQATSIAKDAGKPVLCIETQEIILSTSPPARTKANGRNWLMPSWLKLDVKRAPTNGTADKKIAAATPDVGYVLLDPNDQSKPRTLISYLGPTGENVAEMIESVRQACLSRAEFPVVVMSEFDQDLMSSCEAPIEFLPAMRHVAALKPDEYARYVDRRWALILEKWKIERQVTLAASFDEFLAAQTPAA